MENTIENKLLILLEKYEEKSMYYVKIMLNDFEVNNKKDFIQKKSLFMSGELQVDSTLTYLFHGRGCRILNDSAPIIDWDFGYGDKWFGVNVMLFMNYLEIYDKENKKLFDYNEIHKILEGFVNQGVAYTKAGLYYLT